MVERRLRPYEEKGSVRGSLVDVGQSRVDSVE